MTMMQNVAVNTEAKKKIPDVNTGRTPSLKLKERNIKHTKINNIKDLNLIYTYGEMLGRGVFGTVVEVTDKVTKKVWALKIVDKKNIKGSKINTIENEIKILRMVNHPHIIYLEQTYESQKHIYLVIERCTTELANILKKKKKFSENEARKVMDHLSSAIAYLHKYEIIHRDLKVENILTAPNPNDSSDELYIKVSDFGLGIIQSCSRPDQMLSDRCGTLIYMAPEIISRSSYSQQCDVWAMGVICYLLLTGHYPFYSKDENELSDLICTHEPNYSGFAAGSPAANFIMKLLNKNPALRISAAEVCKQPWIRGTTAANTPSNVNVLDMMQLWRSEMMVEPASDNGSDWAQAFSSLQLSSRGSSSVQVERSLSLAPRIPSICAGTSKTNMISESSSKSGKVEKKFQPKERRITQSRSEEKTHNCKTNEANKTAKNAQRYNSANSRALNVKGKNTKLIRIGKVRKESPMVLRQ